MKAERKITGEAIKGGPAMKRWIAGILAVALLGTIVVAVPRPAVAGGHANGYCWGGLAEGAITGLAVGAAFVPRPVCVAPPVYQPQPVYVEPAPTVV
jgi:hypothetical protein